MGEVLGKCWLCEEPVEKEVARVVEVRRKSGALEAWLSCLACWIYVMRPKWMAVMMDGELVEAWPSAASRHGGESILRKGGG